MVPRLRENCEYVLPAGIRIQKGCSTTPTRTRFYKRCVGLSFLSGTPLELVSFLLCLVLHIFCTLCKWPQPSRNTPPHHWRLSDYICSRLPLTCPFPKICPPSKICPYSKLCFSLKLCPPSKIWLSSKFWTSFSYFSLTLPGLASLLSSLLPM